MTWFRVDDDLPFHRKVVAAGNAAMGLWVRAGAWCAQHLTDGFVPDDMVAILGTASQRSKLIKAGLWVEVPGGCQFHQWLGSGRQPTAESVREKRARGAERQAKHRNSMYANTQATGASNAVTDASVTGGVTPFVTPAPSRPDPFGTSPDGEVPAPAAPHPTGSSALFDVEPVGPTATDATTPPLANRTDGQALVAHWIDLCRKRPPGTVIGQTGKVIAAMLEDGVAFGDIQAGIDVWSAKGLHPAALPAVVNEVMNARPQLRLASGGGPIRVPTTTQRVQGALAHLDPEEP